MEELTLQISPYIFESAHNRRSDNENQESAGTNADPISAQLLFNITAVKKARVDFLNVMEHSFHAHEENATMTPLLHEEPHVSHDGFTEHDSSIISIIFSCDYLIVAHGYYAPCLSPFHHRFLIRLLYDQSL